MTLFPCLDYVGQGQCALQSPYLFMCGVLERLFVDRVLPQPSLG